MTTLVTGATGFLGSHVARRLVASGECVRVLARRGSSTALLDGLDVEFREGDLRDVPSLVSAMENVHRVFHVAADYRLWARDSREIYDSNVGGTRNLLEAARRANVERFVYTSTVGTIAVPRHGSLPNEDTQSELSEMIGHYKRSKFLAEKEAMEAARQGMPVVIVNPTTPVGPGDAKPTPTGRIIVDFLNGRMPAYVDTGLNVAAVEDVAAGHLLAAEKGIVGGRYILGGRNMTLKEILASLARISGQHPPRIRLPHFVALASAYVDSWISRMMDHEPRIPLDGVRMARHAMFVDCSKAQRELGYAPGPVDAALARAVRWYQEHGYIRPSRAMQTTQIAAAQPH